ncbi:hypothetical protein GCM10010317_006850 [Streptomyces mirabilis]|nr:hypothetical protein GCM10010317_006850 [Streptomyces mirabilis]
MWDQPARDKEIDHEYAYSDAVGRRTRFRVGTGAAAPPNRATLRPNRPQAEPASGRAALGPSRSRPEPPSARIGDSVEPLLHEAAFRRRQGVGLRE